jgi:eukaryotic-like serine/threonine-protein kinase
MPPQDNLAKDGTPAADAALAPTISVDTADTTARVIGRYHLVRRIGEGGMGEVWLAEQKEPVRRRVALKLIKGGLNTRETIARFNSERQALALMDHPAIAKVFDADATQTGAPYFVMEYVAGAPITDYCDNHRLSTRERLELFADVCDGVQHAHQKAIIHRDLKPSNILVTEVDSKAAPKIIDFGVAKALTQSLGTETMFTRTGGLVGTPGYISPEQASSSGEDIDTRTDVYSLGVIFYELLAGAPPLDLGKLGLEEFLRKLREDEPPKPSTKVSTQDRTTSTDVADKRQIEPLALARQLRGELDSIALKALEKERSRRYASASEFAADVRRYLNNEPVLAVPPSLAYRARKFARRYRVALATACAFVLVLVAAAVISIRQSIRANREAAVAEAVNNFLQHDLLSQANVGQQSGGKPDRDIKVRTALDRAASRIEGKFEKQPEVEAAIRDTIGKTYEGLGLFPDAEKQLQPAVDLSRRALGPDDPRTLAIMSDLVFLKEEEGKYAEAEVLAKQVLEADRRVLGPENLSTVTSMNVLAGAYYRQGKNAQAEALYKETADIRRRKLGPENRDTLQAMYNLGLIYIAEGRYAEAEALRLKVLETQRRVLGPDHPDTLGSMGNLAVVYFDEGKYAEAEALDSQTLDADRRVLGPEHPRTLVTMNNLAGAYSQEGKYDQAEALDNQILEIRRRLLGPEHPYTLDTMGELATVYSNEGRYPQAEALFTQTLEIAKRGLGPENPYTLAFASSFADAYQRQGKYAMAETYAAQALDGRRKALGADHPDTMASEADLALAEVSEGKFAEAEPLAHEALDAEKKLHPEDWQRFRVESLLGESLAGEKKYSEAEPLLVEGYQGMLARKDRMAVPDLYHLNLAHQWVVQFYQAWGKPDKATPLMKEGP